MMKLAQGCANAAHLFVAGALDETKRVLALALPGSLALVIADAGAGTLDLAIGVGVARALWRAEAREAV